MLETGQLIPITFKGRTFNAVVIDPNGLGEGRPTIGIGYRGMSRHTEVPAQTFVDRVSEIEGVNVLKLPSGKTFKVSEITANDGNVYRVIEATDWVDLVSDWAKNPGRLGKKARNGLIDFLTWYAAEGMYAAAYTILKRAYTYEDSQIIQQWLVAREAGKPARKDWAYAIAEQGGPNPYKFGKWTNYVYKGLFGMDAAEMKRLWEAPVSGSRHIARNYIPESVGVDMVAYCEKLISVLEFDDLERAHDEAIRLTQMKFRQRMDSDRLGG
ncbi:MAG: hypothetical protein HC800_15975 [Phormidesmis sp. RL_2_1]|nr:hypothetical protein [Phormidesmis sp. RL_2_1]